MAEEDCWKPGTVVRIVGLVKAAQHNGKLGRLSARKGDDGRLGVQLAGRQMLSVRPSNLQVASSAALPAEEQATKKPKAQHASQLPEQRELTREKSLLAEFNGSQDPDVFALYYHFKDMAFDCFNAPEYIDQMLRYYAAGMSVVEVVPRTICGNEYFLVCLQHSEIEKNSLCQVAFQCMRQFVGISMLVKKRCFVSNKPDPAVWSCPCVCYSSKESEASSPSSYKKLCKLVRASNANVDEESVEIEICGPVEASIDRRRA